MAPVLIKNLPDELHRQLKQRAERHHRSLHKELIAVIETAPHRRDTSDLPKPVPLRKPITQETLE
jgi:plasmid stability protein